MCSVIRKSRTSPQAEFWNQEGCSELLLSDSLRVVLFLYSRRSLSVRRVPHHQPAPGPQTSEQGASRSQLSPLDVRYRSTVLVLRDDAHLCGAALRPLSLQHVHTSPRSACESRRHSTRTSPNQPEPTIPTEPGAVRSTQARSAGHMTRPCPVSWPDRTNRRREQKSSRRLNRKTMLQESVQFNFCMMKKKVTRSNLNEKKKQKS